MGVLMLFYHSDGVLSVYNDPAFHIGVLAMLYGQYNVSRDIAYCASYLKFIYWLWWSNEEPLASMEPFIWTKGTLNS